MDLGKFYTTFLDYDFDNLLLEQNNELVNCNTSYLTYKNTYLQQTRINYIRFTDLFNSIQCTDTIDNQNKKFTYNFIDKQLFNHNNQCISNLITEQNQLYNNLINHIKLLNKTCHL